MLVYDPAKLVVADVKNSGYKIKNMFPVTSRWLLHSHLLNNFSAYLFTILPSLVIGSLLKMKTQFANACHIWFRKSDSHHCSGHRENCNTQIFSLVCSGINLFSFFFPSFQFSRFVIRLYFLFHTNFKITIYDNLDKIIWSQLSNDDAIVYTLTLEGI